MYQKRYCGKYCHRRIRMGLIQLLYAVTILVFLISTMRLFGSAHMHNRNLGILPPAQITVVEVPW